MPGENQRLDQISIGHIRTFVAAAKASNFSEAAKELGTSRAYVSRAVKVLEARLDMQLFQRTTRDVSLTPAGRELLLGFEGVLYRLEAITDMASSRERGLEGSIRLSTSRAFGVHYVLLLVDRFMALHPGIRVEVELSEEIDNLIRSNLDLVVRIGPLADSSLVCRRLAELELVLAVPQTIVARFGLPDAIDDLTHIPAIEFEVPGTGRVFPWQFMVDGIAREFAPTSVVGRFRTPEMLVTAVLAGRGMTQIPRYLVESAVLSRTVELGLTANPIPKVPVSICFPAQRELNTRLRTFVDFMVAECPDVF